jgi:hypothetical protein
MVSKARIRDLNSCFKGFKATVRGPGARDFAFSFIQQVHSLHPTYLGQGFSVRGENVELLNVKSDGIYRYHCFKGKAFCLLTMFK